MDEGAPLDTEDGGNNGDSSRSASEDEDGAEPPRAPSTAKIAATRLRKKSAWSDPDDGQVPLGLGVSEVNGS